MLDRERPWAGRRRQRCLTSCCHEDTQSVLRRPFESAQLTPIGVYQPVFIAAEITHNRFRIAGGTPGQKISWLVTGIRRDVWADRHRIEVEENKKPEHAGKFLHPAEAGQPP